jgi:hypothetical protein
VKEQEGQERAHAAALDLDHATVIDYLEGAEDPELHVTFVAPSSKGKKGPG